MAQQPARPLSTPGPCHLSLTLGGPSGSIAGALQDLVPLALGGVVGWQPGSGKVGGSPVESQVTAGPGSRPKIWCRRSAVRPRQPARHNLHLDLLLDHHQTSLLQEKDLEQVQAEEKDRSSEEEV